MICLIFLTDYKLKLDKAYCCRAKVQIKSAVKQEPVNHARARKINPGRNVKFGQYLNTHLSLNLNHGSSGTFNFNGRYDQITSICSQ
jgi:hypothetical protein